MSARVLHKREAATPQALFDLLQPLAVDCVSLRFFDNCRVGRHDVVGFMRHNGEWRAAVTGDLYKLSLRDIMQATCDMAARAAVVTVSEWPAPGVRMADFANFCAQIRAAEERAAHAELKARAFVVALTTGLAPQVLHDCVWRAFLCACVADTV
jgi:hypothetical protein